MHAALSIVIPSYNTWWLLERCLAGLERHALPGQQVIVVDDGSSDETRVRLAQTRGVDVVFTGANRGFSGACNAGAALARAPLLFFLNADTEVLPGSLEALVDAIGDPEVGVVGAKLVYPEGGLQHVGLVVDRDGILRHGHWFRPEGFPDADVARDYPVVTGAAFLVRRDDFERLGRFDEGYQNGYEDAEFCFRTWASGKRVRYEPRARFVHVESASPQRHARNQQNHERFMGRWGALLAKLPRVAGAEIPEMRIEGSLDAVGATGDEMRRMLAGVGAQPPAERRAVAGMEHVFGALMYHADGSTTAFVAPANAEEAARLVADIRAGRYLVPTWHAFGLLRAAGVPLEALDVWRSGIDPSDRGARDESLVVTYVSDVTTAAALRAALVAWRAARERLVPLGVRFELRSALDETALRALLRDAVAGDTALADVAIALVSGDPTGDDVLDGAGVLLVTGPTDRVDRVTLLALATGVDVVALAGPLPELARLAGADAYLAAATADELPALLRAAFATGRRSRVLAAQRDVRRRFGSAKTRIRLDVVLRRRDAAYADLSEAAIATEMFARDGVPDDVRALLRR